MLYNTLNKYKIVQFDPKEGEKVDKGSMKVVGEEKGENEEKVKGTVASVVKSGWQVEKQVIRPAEVTVYS